MPVLHEVADSLAERAARAGVGISLEGDEEIALPLRPRMIKVIGENLAGNALRYAGPGATFTLSVSEAGDGVALVGSDDGIGVAEADLPRLFERFYRGDRARASRGTGLGLAIVKHIVTQAGGTVEATGCSRRGVDDSLHVHVSRLIAFTTSSLGVHHTDAHGLHGEADNPTRLEWNNGKGEEWLFASDIRFFLSCSPPRSSP